MAKNTTTRKPSGKKYTVISEVTLPDFQFDEFDYEYLIRFDGPIIQAPARDDGRTPRPGDKAKTPPFKARIIDLETGELYSAIIFSMLRNRVLENYPDESYVGRDFVVIKHAKEKGKDYFGCTVNEIDLETGGESELGDNTANV